MSTKQAVNPQCDNLLTLVQLAKVLNLHPATCRGLWRRRLIPGIKLGHRTLRFDYDKVMAALDSLQEPTAIAAFKRKGKAIEAALCSQDISLPPAEITLT